MERVIEIGKTYRHFKGNTYKVINIAIDSEDLSKKVIYENIDDGKVWVRDYDMFNSLIDKEKYPRVTQIYRFESVDE